MSRRLRETGREVRWRGVVVSDGVAQGRVLRLHSGGRTSVYRATIDARELERETRRFRAAVRLVRRQLLSIKKRAERVLGSEQAYIFEAHLLMLEDGKFLEDVESYIRVERVNAEWAVRVVADRLLAIYSEITDEYLRERSSDVEDVMRRILVALSGEQSPTARLTHDAIVVAEELLPTAAAELDFAHVKAIASDGGGWTSHTAIIARGMGIPAVVGLRDLYRHARTGDEIIVDARTGDVILHPAPKTSEAYRAEREAARAVAGSDETGGAAASGGQGAGSVAASVGGSGGVTGATAAATGDAEREAARKPLLTLDGVEIFLRANVELPAEYESVRHFGARGIGLYRSEFLLTQHGAMPSEDEQCAAYVELAELAGADGATVRLFDLGGEKLGGDLEMSGERNPALGLRAIRFCLQREDVLRPQVRAVLRAAARGRLDLVLPMISDITDVRRARRIIEEEHANLSLEGRAPGRVRVGAMIEVPSAVLVADRLAREVDFFSLGTNDLIQYLLAVDRGNDEVAEWFRSLHPAVLQSIARTLDAAHDASIPAIVCGEMAAKPPYAFLLVGLGATELSMTPSSIPRVRQTLEAITAERARSIALECLECATADDVEELVRRRLGDEWPQLFPPKVLPAPKSAE